MKKKNYIKFFLSWAQLAMFCLILANGILYVHSHKLANGQIIVHAHPYFPLDNGQPLPYNHSSNELVILAKFYDLQTIQSGLTWFNFSCPEKNIFVNKKQQKSIAVLKKNIRNQQHRGPPVIA